MTSADRADTPLGGEIRQAIAVSPLAGELPGGKTCRAISFRDYMAMCLYHPVHGYYRSGKPRVGREGDFYTSAFIGDIMGEQLADRMAALAAERYPGEERVEVLEWGGGTGRLGKHMLARWAEIGEAGARFRLTVVDGNPAHLQEASAALSEEIAAGRARVMGTAAAEADAETWRGRPVIVTANELLDAFPVYRVVQRSGRLREWGIAWDADGGTPVPCLLAGDAAPKLRAWLDDQGVRLAEGQTTEIGLEGAAWTARMASLLGERSLLVLIDYGDVTAELTSAHRMDGTLMCYERHRAHADPCRRPGECDITAHVDFDLVRDFASQAGWQELWYGTQKRFLVETGILEKLAAHHQPDPFHPTARRNRAIRQLLLSDGMSELFKVQIWGK